MSRAIGSAEYIMCMDIRLYLDTCTSERRRGARVCVRLRRVRARVFPRWVDICLSVQSPLPNAPVCLSRACGCVFRACMVSFPWLQPVRPHVCPSSRGRRGPHAHAVHGRSIRGTKVKALPEWLGRCKLLEGLCVPRPPPPPPVRVRGGAGAALLRVALPRRGAGPRRLRRPARGRGGPGPPGAAARWARRDAHNTELAALPAAVEWPSLKYL